MTGQTPDREAPNVKPNDSSQLEINFDGGGSEEGLDRWHKQRRRAMKQLARSLGLPLDHQVEVCLAGGIRLRGQLRLCEAKLFIEKGRDLALDLTVDGVSFKASEIESCVRMG
jgi:hypothetical protein